MKDIIVIADTQVHGDVELTHIEKLSEYIWEHKPEDVVHIGDNWDFPSLSSYASTTEMEGRRLVDDMQSGFKALKKVMYRTKQRTAQAKQGNPYSPHLNFVMGNHENRLARYLDSNPVLDGMFDLKGMIEAEGWKVYDFLDPCWVHDIAFIHYLPNPQSGRAIGGGIENKLNKVPHSFVHGHQQQYQFGRRQNMQGRPLFGVCAGSFYMHDEEYRGPAGNTEIRGFVHMRGFTNRFGYLDYDVEFVSMERLMQDY